MNKNNLILIAGGLWVLIGAFLLFRGALMYQIAVDQQNATQNAVVLSLAVGLIVGLAKGHFVLSKSARRNKTRIQGLPAPIRLHHIFSMPYYGLIAGMIALGILLRTWNEYLGGYLVVAGIYCAVGAALIISSRIYWNRDAEAIEDTP